MGAELAALFSLSSAFAVVALVFAGWMAWRIVDKAGLPGWAGLIAILLTLTGIGSLVSVILLWVFAYMRWPRDEGAVALVTGPGMPPGAPQRPSAPAALAPPPKALAGPRGWRLVGAGLTLAVDGSAPAYLLTGEAGGQPAELVVPDPSVGRPHARLLVAGDRLGLEDLGTPGGTLIDGARLLPEHGPRDITAARSIRLGSVELALSRV